MTNPTDRIRREAAEYRRDAADERPLGAYSALVAVYAGAVTVLAVLGRRRMPGALQPSDLALGAIATFTTTRTVTKEPIASPIRMPFTRFEGVSGPSELHEEVRVTGWRHAVGELLTCPFCLSQWIATSLVVGVVVAPRFTRTAMSVLAIVGVSDFLQLAYAGAQQLAED